MSTFAAQQKKYEAISFRTQMLIHAMKGDAVNDLTPPESGTYPKQSSRSTWTDDDLWLLTVSAGTRTSHRKEP